MRVRLQATGKPDCGPLGSKTIAKAGIKPEKKKTGIVPDGQRFVGHREIRPQRRRKSGFRTSPVIQKEGSFASP